jgi:hypothetical protein
LAKKIVDNQDQWGIDYSDGNLWPREVSTAKFKENNISAWFKDKSHLEIAMHDIGKEDLKEMVETLANIGE